MKTVKVEFTEEQLDMLIECMAVWKRQFMAFDNKSNEKQRLISLLTMAKKMK